MRSIGRPPDVMNRTTKAAAITRKTPHLGLPHAGAGSFSSRKQ